MNRLAVLFFACITFTSCSELTKVSKSTDYDYKLKKADEFYAKQNYNNAQVLYEDIFPVMKGTPRFEDLYYKYAYCAFYLKDFINAENLFKEFVELFPNSAKTEECDYMRAYSYYKQSPKYELDQTNTTKAIALMQAFINTHPNSGRIKEASTIIDNCREKIELKEFKAAELYYTIGNYRAANTTFTTLTENFPDSPHSDEYKYWLIKSAYLFAQNSIEEKMKERYEQVVAHCADFTDRFPDSKLKGEVDNYLKLTKNDIKKLPK
jgi:outer membrane protein assembly factor BamD